MRCWFSPNGGCLRALLASIEGAREEVLLQAFAFGSVPLLEAFSQAMVRGIRVRVLLDRDSYRKPGSQAKGLKKRVELYLDGQHQIAHNKVLIVDRTVLYTGSYNFTRAAEFGNAENLLEVTEPEIVAKYVGNWEYHRSHSVRCK